MPPAAEIRGTLLAAVEGLSKHGLKLSAKWCSLWVVEGLNYPFLLLFGFLLVLFVSWYCCFFLFLCVGLFCFFVFKLNVVMLLVFILVDLDFFILGVNLVL